MAATAPSIELSASETPIPVCTPHLMPFHIKYTGPAPISTYFRPKASPQATFGETTATSTVPTGGTSNVDSQVTSESQDTLVPESHSAEEERPALSRNSTSATLADVDMTPSEETGVPSSSELHLAAAFRGRAIRGLTVDLPEGYAGVVLSSPDKTVEAKAKAKAKKAPASRRSSKRAAAAEEIDEEDLLMLPEPSGPVKTLEATGTFSSFVLWNADNPVDEGRDEYLRTLTEWTKIAAEIHRYDD